MKKVLLLIVLFFGAWSTYAQDVDSVQVQQPITLDSLAVQVEQLKHDVSYLQCENELLKIMLKIDNLSQDINIKSNAIYIDVYHVRYDRELYSVFADNYDAYNSYLESLKEGFETAKKFVLYQVFTSNFSDTQIDLLDSYINTINSGFSSAEAALRYYNTGLRAYKDKR